MTIFILTSHIHTIASNWWNFYHAENLNSVCSPISTTPHHQNRNRQVSMALVMTPFLYGQSRGAPQSLPSEICPGFWICLGLAAQGRLLHFLLQRAFPPSLLPSSCLLSPPLHLVRIFLIKSKNLFLSLRYVTNRPPKGPLIKASRQSNPEGILHVEFCWPSQPIYRGKALGAPQTSCAMLKETGRQL